MNQTEGLKQKLMNEFGVELKVVSYSVYQPPVVELLFPDTVTQNIYNNLNGPGLSLDFFLTKAEISAKQRNFAPNFAAKPEAYILNRDPYRIEIQSAYAMIYFFVFHLISYR